VERALVGPVVLTPADVVRWAAAQGLEVRLIDDLPPVKTVAQAAEVMGTGTAAIAKSVVFVNGEEPLVVLATGDARIVDRLVVDHVRGARNRFRLARPDEVLEWTGYPVGGVPPFGHRVARRTLMDDQLLALARVYLGGGTDRSLLEAAPGDVARVTAAEVGRFTIRTG
jgi:prolyl-tRNA editing enzyme YbaK/EbsC (Cys-tRNA(Pro) deacylase)